MLLWDMVCWRHWIELKNPIPNTFISGLYGGTLATSLGYQVGPSQLKLSVDIVSYWRNCISDNSTRILIAAQTSCKLFSDEGPDTNFSVKAAVGSCVPAFPCHCSK